MTKDMSNHMTGKFVKSMSKLKKKNFSQMLKPSNFGFFILHNPMSPGNMLKREHCDAVNDSKIRIIVACKAKLN